MEMEPSPAGLYKWEISSRGGKEHHCGICHKPLANKKNSQRICVGYHAVPCAKFHTNLFIPGREIDCKPCRNSSEEHWKRHKDIAEALNALYSLLDMTAPNANNTTPTPPLAPQHAPPPAAPSPDNNSAAATTSTPQPAHPTTRNKNLRRKDLKAEKKLQRALTRAATTADGLTTSAGIAFVGRVMHPSATDDNGGLREFDDPDFLTNLVWCGQDAYVVPPHAVALRDLLKDCTSKGMAPRMPRYEEVAEEVLVGFGLPEGWRKRVDGGRKVHEAFDRVVGLMRRDFEVVWREEQWTARRRGGFLRFMSKGTLMRVLEIKSKRRELADKDNSEEEEEEEEEEEVEEEFEEIGVEDVDEWGGWDMNRWVMDEEEVLADMQEDNFFEKMPSIPDEEECLPEEEASHIIPEHQAATGILRPTLEKLLAMKKAPDALGIVPGCPCGSCFERSSVAENFLRTFVLAAKSNVEPKDKPLSRKRAHKKPNHEDRKNSLSNLLGKTDWTIPDVSYYLDTPKQHPNHTTHSQHSPDDPVRLLVPHGPTVLATDTLPRATARHFLSSPATTTATATAPFPTLPTGLVPVMIDDALAAHLLSGRAPAPAALAPQLQRNAGALAEQLFQFHLAAHVNGRKNALRARLRALRQQQQEEEEARVELEEELRVAKALAACPERVCLCGGLRTERVVECAGKACRFGVFHARCVGLTSKVSGERWFCAECLERVRVEIMLGDVWGGESEVLGVFREMVAEEVFVNGEVVVGDNPDEQHRKFERFFAEEGRFHGLLKEAVECVREMEMKKQMLFKSEGWPSKYQGLSREIRSKWKPTKETQNGVWKPKDNEISHDTAPATSSTTGSEVSMASTQTGFWAVPEEKASVHVPRGLIRRQACKEGWHEKVEQYLLAL